MATSIGDVKAKILSVFKEFKVGAGQYLPLQSLLSRTTNWTPPEQKLVDDALKALVADGMIEKLKSPPGWKLTQAGEDAVY